VRAPSEDELHHLLLAFMDWRVTPPRLEMPAELYERIRRLIEWELVRRPWSRRQIQQMRWFAVREGRDRPRLSWDEAYEYASQYLRGTPAQAGRDMMKKDYQAFQKRLPPERRRPRRR